MRAVILENGSHEERYKQGTGDNPIRRGVSEEYAIQGTGVVCLQKVIRH